MYNFLFIFHSLFFPLRTKYSSVIYLLAHLSLPGLVVSLSPKLSLDVFPSLLITLDSLSSLYPFPLLHISLDLCLPHYNLLSISPTAYNLASISSTTYNLGFPFFFVYISPTIYNFRFTFLFVFISPTKNKVVCLLFAPLLTFPHLALFFHSPEVSLKYLPFFVLLLSCFPLCVHFPFL